MNEKQAQVIAAVERLGSMSEAARYIGISRQRVHQIMIGYKSKKLKGNVPVAYTDTGCPDGTYPSCLDCPNPDKCKDE